MCDALGFEDSQKCWLLSRPLVMIMPVLIVWLAHSHGRDDLLLFLCQLERERERGGGIFTKRMMIKPYKPPLDMPVVKWHTCRQGILAGPLVFSSKIKPKTKII